MEGDILNVIGVILAIFLPSAATLYLKLSEMDPEENNTRIIQVKGHIRSSTVVVILLFCMVVLLLIIKGLGDGSGRWGAAFNGLALVMLLAHVLVLFDITRAVFLLGDRSKDGS